MKIGRVLKNVLMTAVFTALTGMIVFMSGKEVLALAAPNGKSPDTAVPFVEYAVDDWVWTVENGETPNYFSFEMEVPGIFELHFTKPVTDKGAVVAYTVGIYDEDAKEVWKCAPDANAGDEYWYNYFVGLRAGNYYLELTPSDSSEKPITMDLWFFNNENLPQRFEKESNNDMTKANRVEFYEEYKGYYGAEENRYSNPAGDWFCFEGEKNHLYAIGFSENPFDLAGQIALGSENEIKKFAENDIEVIANNNMKSIEYVAKEDGKIYFAFLDGDGEKSSYIQEEYVFMVRPQTPKENTWKQINNKWYYFGKDGKAATNRLVSDNGKWYYLGADGTRVTGWIKEAGMWRFFGSNGVMQTGWVKDKGKWYYLKKNGLMETGWLKDNGKWYYLSGSGAMQTGWVKDGGKWYYLSESGAMQTGWVKVSGKWYYLNGSGAMQTGWVKVSGKWYYLNGSGVMQTGWVKDNNKWYYLESSGAMAVNKWISGKYWVGSNGAMATNAWVDGGKYYVDANGCWVPNKKR